ncbi:hypothetical protein GMLC_07710 [Geomonas limicola]|uniref:Lipoprotein n=1 Tax=Geomonas limicola TaxID=2740186 RepID=A0A6V8N3S5_9BACT|nr:hypothetical protein [Geomonas limicola]GFO67192.1 hypothetical protein GMLC_07710 [Geomonas limicola]
MRVIVIAVVVLALVAAALPSVALAKECTKFEAYAADSVTAYLDSWKNVHRAFTEFGHCDDGGIAEGFDEAISILWAEQWPKLPQMLKYSEKSKDFRAFVYKRIWSETVPEERWRKILKKAQKDCPNGGEGFCREIIRAGK